MIEICLICLHCAIKLLKLQKNKANYICRFQNKRSYQSQRAWWYQYTVYVLIKLQIPTLNPNMRTSNYFTLKFHVVEVTLRVIFHTHRLMNNEPTVVTFRGHKYQNKTADSNNLIRYRTVCKKATNPTAHHVVKDTAPADTVVGPALTSNHPLLN